MNVGIELSGISNEALPGKTDLGYFKVHVNAEGSWANIMRALILIEHTPYGVSLHNMRVSLSPNSAVAESASASTSTARAAAPAKIWVLSLDVKVLTKK